MPPTKPPTPPTSKAAAKANASAKPQSGTKPPVSGKLPTSGNLTTSAPPTKPGLRSVTFKKADFDRFAAKVQKWGKSLSPEEQALLFTVLEKGSSGIRAAGEGVLQSTPTVRVAAEEFNLGQLIVEILLALEGVSAEVDEDGPEWVQEISATTK